jgi:DNA uptake protein ComE-like DNA-binding protein
MLREQKELTGQQLNGLTALVALAVFLTVIKMFIPLWGTSATLPEPFSKKDIGTLTIALYMDGQERGVYFMPPGATIADLMRAAGATRSPEFDSEVDYHRLLTGDKVYLNSVASSPPVIGRMSAAQSLALDLPVDINQASFDDLVLVPGIGESTAARIIALREAKGGLRSREELKELSGIKEKKFDTIKKYFLALP